MGKIIKKIGIVGGGPAGYALAIRMAQNGCAVVLFEKEKLGGTCLNKGCIPTKSILHNTNLIYKSKNLSKFGVSIDTSGFELSKLISHKDLVVSKLNKSLEMLLKTYDITIINEKVTKVETGKIITENRVEACDAVVLATGTVPAKIEGLEADNNFVFNSDGILGLEQLPKSALIVGSGAIGIEWSRIFSDLGVDVTLVEAAENILPIADTDVSARVERLLKKKRIKIEKSVTVREIKDHKIYLSNEKVLTPEVVLIAIGRTPILPELNNDFVLNKGFLNVDENFMTNIKDVYGIGDINGKSMLAHSATHQAIELADYLTSGKQPEFAKKNVPSVIYGMPEVAWFGESEQNLVKNNICYKKILFPISAVGKAQAEEEIDGFIKLLVQDETILGVSIIAPEASAMLMQFAIAKENNLSYKSVLNAIYPHPTFSEAVLESILALDNKSLCLPRSKE